MAEIGRLYQDVEYIISGSRGYDKMGLVTLYSHLVKRTEYLMMEMQGF